MVNVFIDIPLTPLRLTIKLFLERELSGYITFVGSPEDAMLVISAGIEMYNIPTVRLASSTDLLAEDCNTVVVIPYPNEEDDLYYLSEWLIGQYL